MVYVLDDELPDRGRREGLPQFLTPTGVEMKTAEGSAFQDAMHPNLLQGHLMEHQCREAGHFAVFDCRIDDSLGPHDPDSCPELSLRMTKGFFVV